MALTPNAPFRVDTIPEDMKVLRTALRETLRDIPGTPVKRSERRILNLACGRADETGVLAETFGAEAKLSLIHI